MSINGMTCQNGTSLGLTAPVSIDGSILNMYNTGGYTAQIDGNLTLGNGINLGNLVVKGNLTLSTTSNLAVGTGIGLNASTGGINCVGLTLANSGCTITGLNGNAIQMPTILAVNQLQVSGALSAASASISGALSAASASISGALSAASASISGALNVGTTYINNGGNLIIRNGGFFVQNPAGSENLGYIDSNGTLVTTGGLYVQNSAGTANLGYIQNNGALTATSAQINGTLTATGNISTNGHINNGSFNLAPIAYGLITGPSSLSKSYNVNSTPTTSASSITITITNPSLTGNYIPIITFTGLADSQVVPIIEVSSTTSNTITFKSFKLRDSNYNQIITSGIGTWSFYFVVYGN